MNHSQPSLVLTAAVNRLLSERDLPASLTIEQCACELSISMTSFRRKLAQEETSYKLIQSKFLNELCVKALLTNQIKIEDLAIRLGYSERATFERAFRQKFGVTPSQFRYLSLANSVHSNYVKLTEIAENMPPMPSSCQQLLLEKDRDNLNLQKVIEIVTKDVILSGRIMGQASKAIYGKTPQNLQEAISRNLGIQTVVNYALVFAMKDALQQHLEQVIFEQYSQAFLLAPKLFQHTRKLLTKNLTLDIELTEQVLVFSLLGVFLLSHKSAHRHEMVRYSLRGIDDLGSLNRHIHETMGISLYSASSLMLSLWHIDASLVKQIAHLDKVSQAVAKGTEQDELVLFMLSCLYFAAAGHSDFSVLEQKAECLNITNFDEIKQLLATLN
ncbi:helix-turn-helix domain-containing protein [Paraglaciecola arctica]|uniref:helix-turn-helix domain-containing protein n=1 Tax=Paraglaciecola arctica TaxID=1128911 RepID=UPI001C07C61E|nr:helix-turn-helix domain-containing protein [Paraglaciecola arctica]MBU3005078.1 HDOD domain-containing protein [Paraglaciecola arctica]